ncbi:MAG: helix-turn-helix transcriptional regulator [Acidobacteria bacterium]|nr:helix-turn-helix transcriptional regulator [Acidobacteriota bacterium]
MVQRLLPHIQQFVRVRQVLAGAGALGASLADLLASTGLGIIQVDGRGRIAAANDRALALLRTGEGLVDRDGVLGAAVPADNAVLQGLLAGALPSGGGPGAGGSMTGRRGANPQPLVVHLLPLGRPEPAVCTWPGAAVVVADPARRTRLDPALVAAGLGLTPMESRVAVLLTEGKSLREVAPATGCKASTIRWHLRQIFAKRGIARQVDLVRLVLSLAGAAHVRR